jgi:histidyl-tRNA synthetase
VTVLLGPDERAKGEAVVRDMRLKTQVSVPEAQLISTVSEALTRS